VGGGFHRIKILQIWCLLFWCFAGLPALGGETAPSSRAVQPRSEDKLPLGTLKEIYAEVKELGPYPGDHFIKQEFFLGPADDDTYKNEHIVVLIQSVGGGERMKIQVTEMETCQENPRVQLAGKVKSIVCAIEGGRLIFERADYSPGEIRKLAPEILLAIKEKKKLLRIKS
jgi:hypothetical protein